MYIYLDTIFLFFLIFFFKFFRRKHLFVTIKRNIPTLIYTILISRLKGTNKASNWERTLFLHIVKKCYSGSFGQLILSCWYEFASTMLSMTLSWRVDRKVINPSPSNFGVRINWPHTITLRPRQSGFGVNIGLWSLTNHIHCFKLFKL